MHKRSHHCTPKASTMRGAGTAPGFAQEESKLTNKVLPAEGRHCTKEGSTSSCHGPHM